MKLKRMFWDIETSPNVGYFWRPGYKVCLTPENIIKERAIICICWKWEGEKKIYSLTWDNGDDRKMIADFLKVAETADEMVAHNGDHFDLPWFCGQVAKYGLGPVPLFKTVDTYSLAHRLFNYNSYKLDYLARIWFDECKVHTDFSLWKDVCNGSKKALAEMVHYCKQDVHLQELVWGKLEPYYTPKTHMGVFNHYDRWTCPHDGSEDVYRDKRRVTSAGIERHQMRCRKCGAYFTIANTVYNQYLDLEKE